MHCLSKTLLVTLAVLSVACAQPFYNSTGADWQYRAADGTLLGHYHFRYYRAQNVVRFQRFDTEGTTIYFRDYNSITSQIVVLSYKDNSCCWQTESPPPPMDTFQVDIATNFPSIPSDANFVGTALVDGLPCFGWEFMWDGDHMPVVQWVTEQQINGVVQQYPVRTTLAHNGRYLQYNQVTFSPDPMFYFADLERYSQTCIRKTACPMSPPA